MNTKQLSVFLTVARLGNLTRAAEELNYTQSGVTHIIHALERELDMPLLVRSHNGVELTEVAQKLLPRMRSAVDAHNELETEVERLRLRADACLRVGAYASIAQHWLPAIASQYKAVYPDVELTLHMGGITDLYDLMEQDALDCAFVSYQEQRMTERLEWFPLSNDELVAILPENHPVKGALFPVQEFAGREFLMPGMDFDLDILPVFTAREVSPLIRYTNMDDMTILSMVQHGLGWSILSELVVSGHREGLQALPLKPPAYRELGIIFRKDSHIIRMISLFAELARNEVMALNHT